MGYVATIGMFDGVHRGHRFVLERVAACAREEGLQSMAITFDHTVRREPVITPLDEKCHLIGAAGIDRVEVLAFTDELKQMTAREFMQQVLRDRLGVVVLLTGYDNRFGHNREEGFDDYVRYGHEMGIDVRSLPPLELSTVDHPLSDQQISPLTSHLSPLISHLSPLTSHLSPLTSHFSPLTSHLSPLISPCVSSTLIRQLLTEGRVDEAAVCLGRCYAISGRVEHGEHMGTALGFPTANLQPTNPQQLIPGEGAYAVRVRLDDGAGLLPGMMNIGRRPTFEGRRQTLEIHIFDLDANLYGRRLTVELVGRLRSERRFDGAEALRQQLQQDAADARRLLALYGSIKTGK